MKIYVGNLSYRMSEDELRAAFEQYGTVGSVDIILDRETGRSKGFGFVEMPDKEEGQRAIESIDGQEVSGRALRVNEARPREPRAGGGRFHRGPRI